MYTYLKLNEVFETKEEAIKRAKQYVLEKNIEIDNKIREKLLSKDVELNNFGIPIRVESILDVSKLTIENLEEIRILLLEKKENLENIDNLIKQVFRQS